ncbi:MAG: DEAD/DEAH box helicase [Chloroflexi bacterium]|nr:DEAD/DEAH box helicase [Chloroflexota bacterium]MDA1145859.1 DEAD/DEAH box helicase [Chloroflexota bacterium]
MTPISGIVRRLLGGSTPAAPKPTQTPSDRTATDSRRNETTQTSSDGSEGGQGRRRRGRRGGRGRGKGRGEGATNSGDTGNSNGGDDRNQRDDRSNDRGRSGSAVAERSESNSRGRRSGSGRSEETATADRDSASGRGGRSRGGQGRQNRSESDRDSGGDGGRNGNDRNARSGSRNTRGGSSGSDNGDASSRGDGGEKKDNYKWGGVARGERDRGQLDQRRQRAGQRRGFRPSRESLEAPLPEDVAFRSVDSGGAGDILPARRRRPSGIRSTERVMVGGARSLSGIPRTLGGSTPDWSREHERADAANDDDKSDDTPVTADLAGDADIEDDDTTAAVTEAPRRGRAAPAVRDTASADDSDDDDDDDSDTDEGDDAPRRRRGRRGGRRERERREAREAALARAEAEEDDEIPVDHDHAISAIEELPAIVAREAADDDEVAAEVPAAFAALGLSDESLAAIVRLGFTEPTPIQTRAIPELLDGNDVVGLAQTGSGKTLAFGLPMVERIDSDLDEVQAIVLVPTRELAQQVLDVLTDLGRSYGVRTVGLLGGHALKRDFAALREQPQVVVGTPGRIIDHLRRETLSLRHVTYAVLDEADQMLDIGFLPDIRRILGRTPRQRQTALFSATMPTSIRRLIWQFMDDPVTAKVDAELSTVDTIEQIYIEVAQRDKTAGLRELVRRELKGRTLVFCKMKRGVDRVAEDLERRGVRVGALHGDMDQRRRDRVVERFRAGELDILIATNVAARGLDIPEITHVVNFDVPQNAEEYVHRIGRTGRAGRDGKAITFVGEWEFDEFQRVLDEFGDEIRQEQLDLYAPAESEDANVSGQTDNHDDDDDDSDERDN